MNKTLLITAGIAGGLLLLSKRGNAETRAPETTEGFCDPQNLTFSSWPVFPAHIAKYKDFADQYGRSYNVPAQLILAVIWKESNGDEFAIGDCGPAPRVGLMQISEDAAKDAGHVASLFQPCAQQCAEPNRVRREIYRQRCYAEAIFDPATNIQVGTAYLALCKRRANRTWREALWAYNWGIGYVQQVGARSNEVPAVVRAYANDVISRANCGREVA